MAVGHGSAGVGTAAAANLVVAGNFTGVSRSGAAAVEAADLLTQLPRLTHGLIIEE
jgi:hypothetical protein